MFTTLAGQWGIGGLELHTVVKAIALVITINAFSLLLLLFSYDVRHWMNYKWSFNEEACT